MSRTFFDVVQAGNVLQRLWQRCKSEESCDTVFIAGTERKRIPAHRNILTEASEYFDKVLYKNTSKEVEIPSLNGDILQRIIEYCYTGRIVITDEIAVELLKTAHMLFLRNLVTACENFLADQLHLSNCFGLTQLAERYHCTTLFEKANSFCLKELLKMYGTNQFLSLKVEQVSLLMASDDLCVASEEEVFNNLMKWIEHDQSEREKHKADLLKLVRMPLLERSFLIKNVKPICSTAECREIYMEAIEWHLSSECKLTKPRGREQHLMGISQVNNKLLIHYFCQKKSKWMKWVRELENRSDFGFALLENDLFIVGGRTGGNNYLNTVICLNLKTMTLKEISPMKENRVSCGLAVLNGILYVVGGQNSTGSLSSVEKFDPKTNKWEAVASMLVARYCTGIVAFNQKLYVVGGNCTGVTLSSAECYDPIENVWQSIGAMTESRFLHGVAVANGQLYAVGGNGKKTIERYDPQINEWSVIGSLSEGIIFVRCTTLNSKVLVCFDDHIEVYNSMTNEWKKIAFFKCLNIKGIFSYSDELLTTEFIEN